MSDHRIEKCCILYIFSYMYAFSIVSPIHFMLLGHRKLTIMNALYQKLFSVRSPHHIKESYMFYGNKIWFFPFCPVASINNESNWRAQNIFIGENHLIFITFVRTIDEWITRSSCSKIFKKSIRMGISKCCQIQLDIYWFRFI